MKKSFLKKVSAAAIAVTLAFGMPSVASAKSTKWIIIHNRTSNTISQVYFSEPYASAVWGTDFLGVDYIYPEGEFRFNVSSDICMIDLKTVFDNGASHTLRFDICKANHVDDLPNGLVVAF